MAVMFSFVRSVEGGHYYQKLHFKSLEGSINSLISFKIVFIGNFEFTKVDQIGL